MNISQKKAETLIGNPKFCSLKEALDYINGVDKNSRIDVWCQFLIRPDLAPSEAIAQAVKNDERFSWETVLERSDVQEYLLNIPTEEALPYAQKIQNLEIWQILLRRIDVQEYVLSLPAQDAIKYGEIFQHDLVWDEILKSQHIRNYIQTISVSEVVVLAKRLKCQAFWKLIILTCNNITPKEIISFQPCINTDAENMALSREDFQVYLQALNPGDAIILGKEWKNQLLWGILLTLESIQNYLNQISLNEALQLANTCHFGQTHCINSEGSQTIKNVAIWPFVISRTDIPLLTAISYATELDWSSVWDSVLGRNDVKEFLDAMSPLEILSYSKEIGKDYFLEKVLEREDVKSILF